MATYVPILIGLAMIAWGGIRGIRILKAEDPAMTLPQIGDILLCAFEVFLGTAFMTGIAAFGLIAAVVGLGSIIIKVVQRSVLR